MTLSPTNAWSSVIPEGKDYCLKVSINAADKLRAPQATGSFIGLFDREFRRYHTETHFVSFKSG